MDEAGLTGVTGVPASSVSFSFTTAAGNAFNEGLREGLKEKVEAPTPQLFAIPGGGKTCPRRVTTMRLVKS